MFPMSEGSMGFLASDRVDASCRMIPRSFACEVMAILHLLLDLVRNLVCKRGGGLDVPYGEEPRSSSRSFKTFLVHIILNKVHLLGTTEISYLSKSATVDRCWQVG